MKSYVSHVFRLWFHPQYHHNVYSVVPESGKKTTMKMCTQLKVLWVRHISSILDMFFKSQAQE